MRKILKNLSNKEALYSEKSNLAKTGKLKNGIIE